MKEIINFINPNPLHQHLCGLDKVYSSDGTHIGYSYFKDKGCGHIFKHKKPIFSTNHICPNCKNETTTTICNRRDIKQFKKHFPLIYNKSNLLK